MIKKPFSFVFGIICGICLLADIMMGKDPFVIIVVSIATFVNFMIAFGEED